MFISKAEFTEMRRKMEEQEELLKTVLENEKNNREEMAQCRVLLEQIKRNQMGIVGHIQEESISLKNTLSRQYPLTMLQFEVHLVEHCNLNCQNCDHYSPIAKEKYVDVEVYRKDFRRLMELTGGKATRIFLLGGEPLLHPQVIELIKIARENFKNLDTRIELVTNGILLKEMRDEFWKTCYESDIGIAITKYPINLDYEELRELARGNGVKLRFFGNSAVMKTSWHLPLDLEGKQDYRLNFMRCWRANNCITLKNGKMYACNIPAHIEHFNEYFDKNIPVTKDDYVDIYEVDSLERIVEKLNKPFPFCRYCNIACETRNHPWKVSTREIEEWT